MRKATRKPLELSATYSIAQLHEAMNSNISVYTLRRMLQTAGVKLMKSGRVDYVPLVEVYNKLPLLWDSLVLIERARHGD